MQLIKQLAGWRSDAVALRYTENSMKSKENIFHGITHASTSIAQVNSSITTAPVIEISSQVTATNNLNQSDEYIILNPEDWCEDFDMSGVTENLTKSSLTAEPPSATACLSQSEKEFPVRSNTLENFAPEFHVHAFTSKGFQKILIKEPVPNVLTMNKSNLQISTKNISFLKQKPVKVQFQNLYVKPPTKVKKNIK